MQFPNEEDDGDFTLNSSARSRLSSLFEGDSKAGDVNQALTFTAPKQPRKSDKSESQTSTEALKLIHVGVVHAYKLKEGKYTNEGKFGCAILGHHQSSSYKFLLYKGKQIHITSCSINLDFDFRVQTNNYATFYDERNENWSVNFESEIAFMDFIKQVFDSNTDSDSSFRVRLGKSKVIKGWSEGLVGAQKGSRRLLVIPPSLAYGSAGLGSSVPPNSTLIFDIHVLRVRSHSPGTVKAVENASKNEVLPRHSFSQEDNIKSRGASISEQLTQSPRKDKAQLISRMAKMGTATLPLKGAIAALVSSDSENEDVPPQAQANTCENPRTASPKLPSKPHSRHSSGQSSRDQPTMLPQNSHETNQLASVPHPASQVPVSAQTPERTPPSYMAPVPSYPHYPGALGGQFQVAPSHYQMHPPGGGMITPGLIEAHLPLLLSESRTQSSETRLGLSKITDKVDTAIQKIDDLRQQQGRYAGFGQVPFLDGNILVQNMERIIRENNQLKEETESKNTKIQSLNEKICDLFQRNQGFFEESNSMLEQKSDSLQAVTAQSQSQFQSLQSEKERLSSELSDVTEKLKSSEWEVEKQSQKLKELEVKLLESEKEARQQESSLADFRRRTDELAAESEALVNSLREEVKNVKSEKGLFSLKLESLERKCKELEQTEARTKKLLEDSEREIEDMRKAKSKELKNSNHSEEDDSADRDRDRRELGEAKRERDRLLAESDTLKRKLSLTESSKLSSENQILQLEVDIQSALLWKKKYEAFYEKTRALKDQYESRIADLIAESQRLKAAPSTPDFSGEIKRTMNILYKHLQTKFVPGASYTGASVLEMSLQVIRQLTFQVLERKRRESSASSEQMAENDPDTSEMPKESERNVPTKAVDNGLPPRNQYSEAVRNAASIGGSTVPLSHSSRTSPETVVAEHSRVEEVGTMQSSSNITPEKSDSPLPKTPAIFTFSLSKAYFLFYAFLLAYLICWIGAWVHDLETAASSV